MKLAHFNLKITAALLGLVLASGCGSMGDILGGGNGSNNPGGQSSLLQGTVNSVDTRSQRIDLTVDSVDGRSSRQNATIYYDNRTQVSYQNQAGSPANLERGDRVDVRIADNGGGQYVAQTITVTQSVSSNYPNNGNPNNGYPNDGYPSNGYPNGSTSAVQGTVNFVDTQAQRIDLTVYSTNGLRGSNTSGVSSVYYDSRTRVVYQNQAYQPADLERGDQVDVRLASSNGRYYADTITVTRNVRQ
ncbi:MAG: DUF5666 domain-containing protein [Acidobacteriota bacterium]